MPSLLHALYATLAAGVSSAVHGCFLPFSRPCMFVYVRLCAKLCETLLLCLSPCCCVSHCDAALFTTCCVSLDPAFSNLLVCLPPCCCVSHGCRFVSNVLVSHVLGVSLHGHGGVRALLFVRRHHPSFGVPTAAAAHAWQGGRCWCIGRVRAGGAWLRVRAAVSLLAALFVLAVGGGGTEPHHALYSVLCILCLLMTWGDFADLISLAVNCEL